MNVLSHKIPAKTRVFAWKRYIATHLTQFMCPLLCTNYRQKHEINYILYYRYAIFLKKKI